jgi:hypothetical protein
VIALAIGLGAAAPASGAITYAQPANTVSTPQFELDFGNGTFEPELVTSVRWRGSGGTLGSNLVSQGAGGCNGGQAGEFWGQSYGDQDFQSPNPVVSGHTGTWAPVSNRTVEINDSTSTACTGDSVVTPVRTRYSFYDGGASANMIRVERRWGFSAANPTYTAVGMRAYVPRLPAGTYNQVVHPNEAGDALVADGLGCNGGCGTGAGDDNWNGTWLALNASGSNAGVLILRDPANTTSASGVRLVRDSDGSSGANNSGVSLLRTATSQKNPVTEVEYLCFYDVTSWPLANRSPTSLPPGCAAKPVPVNTALPTVGGNAGSPQPGDVLTANDGSWDNANGSFTYQWSRCDGDVCMPIVGAVDKTYTAGLEDFGRRLKVAVTAQAQGGETDTAETTFAGRISGNVYLGGASPGNLQAGAPVQACDAASVCRSTLTDGSGAYRLQLPHSGAWTVTAFPPAGSTAIRATRPAPSTVVDGQETANQDVVLIVPAPPPSNIHFQGQGVRPTTANGVPVFHWQEPVVIRYDVDDPGWDVHGTIEYPGRDPIPLDPGPFNPDPTPACPTCGYFDFPVPPQYPNHGPGTITFHGTPPPGSPEPPQDPAFPIYIDPSGFVRTTDGEPIVGATVTLYRSDTRGGDKQVVPDGSAVMSPMNRTNPDATDSGGHFGWDVITGYYTVRAEATGCHAPGDASRPFVETDEMEIPPPVTDLDIRLECPKPPKATLKATLGLPGKAGKIKVDKRGKFKLRKATVGCPAEATGNCDATITVTAKAAKHAKKTLKLGTSHLAATPGKTSPVTGKLSKKGLKAVKKAKKLKKAKIAISVATPGGETTTGKTSGTLVAGK